MHRPRLLNRGPREPPEADLFVETLTLGNGSGSEGSPEEPGAEHKGFAPRVTNQVRKRDRGSIRPNDVRAKGFG